MNKTLIESSGHWRPLLEAWGDDMARMPLGAVVFSPNTKYPLVVVWERPLEGHPVFATISYTIVHLSDFIPDT